MASRRGLRLLAGSLRRANRPLPRPSLAALASSIAPSRTDLIDSAPVLARGLAIPARLAAPCAPALPSWPLALTAGVRALQGSHAERRVVVEYDEDDTDARDQFIAIADHLEERFPAIMVTGNPEGSHARAGSFEVSFSDSLLFSRLQLQRLPTAEELATPLEALLDEEHKE